MSRSFILSLCFVLISLCSCDSGDIVESRYAIKDSGKTLKFEARITGLEDWNETDYHVALAGFSNDSKYAVMQRVVTLPSDGGPLSVVVSNISDEVSTMELSITNALRKRILTLYALNMEDYMGNGSSDTIHINLGTVDASMLGSLQGGVFNQACVQCHGANGRKAGNLDLTEGNTIGNLRDVQSTQKEGCVRVVSGNPETSLLWQILNEGGENVLRYNHTEVLSSQFKDNLDEVKRLLYDWIKGLKTEK